MQVIYIDRFSPASRKSAVNEIKVLSESGRTRPLAWRQDQLRGLLRLLANKEEEAFRALHDDLGKHRAEAYRDELGSIGGANEEEPTRRSW